MAIQSIGNNESIRKAKEAEANIRKYRAQASRDAAKANKRIKRLEEQGLTDSPAYQALIRDGEPKFSVRGKTHNELQREVSRLNRFLNAKTSTVTGVKDTLKEIADNTGIQYQDFKELKAKSAKFFTLASKVEQYLRTVDDMASAIGYQKIWEQINTYVKQGRMSLDGSESDIDMMIEVVANALKTYETPIEMKNTIWFELKG